MPLFHVEFTVTAVIEAESAEDAKEYGLSEFSTFYADCDLNARILHQIETVSDIPAGWNKYCYPYGYSEKLRPLKDFIS